MGGALREDFDEGIASALGLDAQSFFDCLPGLDPMLGIVERHALHVDRAVQLGDQFSHPQRHAHIGCAALGAGAGLLPDERGGGQLPAGHAVDGVVDEDDRDGNPHLRCGDGFRQADGSQIAIALVTDDDAVGVGALVADGHGWRGHGRPGVAHIEVVVGEDRAAHRAYQNGPV